ncbi:glycosyltransferase family 39 protein [Lysobacter enzymogenes]|uniref:glycosyltransferase family 39 protein n=1 Tax=Lysobacter enzymogenes TaxID=69 RepID=UPI00099C7AEA|nr:glycosyltransferase family 39 protein [Lysobacter enzymogenes]UZW61630.1 glycosyltransferase family 39 protein [Lysobacter enzymogenes]
MSSIQGASADSGANPPRDWPLSTTACILAMVAAFYLLLSRVAALGPPMVFADEYSYAAWSYWVLHREVMPGQAPLVNNWFFSLLYSLAHSRGGELIVKARLLNVLVTALAIVPLYRIAAQVYRPRGALLLAIAFAWAGLGGYIAFFMPESLFAALYVGLLSMLFAYLRQPRASLLVWAAVLHGLLIATKPHGLFLLPPFALLLAVYDARTRRVGWSASALGMAGLYAAATVASYVALESAIFGKLVLNPFGGHYGAQSSIIENGMSPALLLSKGIVALRNHFAFLATLMSLPLLLVAVSAVRNLLRPQALEPQFAWTRPAVWFVLAGFGCFFAVTMAFSAAVAGTGMYESLDRVHGRYYEFALVPLLMYAVLVASVEWRLWSLRLRLAVAATVLAASAAGYWWLLREVYQYHTDFALGLSAFNDRFIRYNCMLAAWAALAVFVLRPRHAGKAILAAMVLYLAWNSTQVDKVRRGANQPGAIDRYGERIDREGKRSGHQFALFRQLDADAYRSAFYMIGDGTAIYLQPGQEFDCRLIEGPSTVIALHGIGVPCGLTPREDEDGISLSSTEPAKPAPAPAPAPTK